ncbi:MAG: pirin family protein [Actinomycetia bacterium]|nr:pirin family protein [Actinomycetes bacterium]
MLVLAPREVPLGGPRAMTVRRTLPHRDRSFVGAWCFVDHYGPDEVAQTGGMDVAPHPHTGLQTVSWLFEGEIEHHDSGGYHGMVRPGEVNLMTSGAGIAHSEVSTAATTTLHGVQLWVVLPEADRGAPRAFEHYAAPEVPVADGVTARVFVGELAGESSPIRTFTPLLGAEVHLAPEATWEVELDPAYEHAVLLDRGELAVDGQRMAHGELAIRDCGATSMRLTAGAEPVTAMLLGGAPYDEEIVMWWNFIGRDHDEIAAFREQWQARSDRFGQVEGYEPRNGREWLPAPELPKGTLRSRGRSGRR